MFSTRVGELLLAFARHLGLDLAALFGLCLLLALAMIDRRTRTRPGRGISVFVATMGVALGTVAIVHMRLFDELTALPDFIWVHRVKVAVIFGAAALPVAFIVGKWRRLAGWIMLLGALAWIPLIAQAVQLAMSGPGIIERMELSRSAMDIENAVAKEDPPALARAILKIKIPTDPKDFDSLLYPSLITLMKHRDPDVVKATCLKIEERGNPEALGPLLDMTPDAPEAKKAISHASDLLAAKPGAAQILLNITLNGEGGAPLKALDLLFNYQLAFLKTQLQVILLKGNSEVRARVSEIVQNGSVGTRDDLVAPLMQALNSDDSSQRDKALESLLTLISEPGIRGMIDPDPLIKILETGSGDQRIAAAKILRELGTAKAVGAFVKASQSNDSRLALIAFSTLIDMNAVSDPNVFAAHLEDEEGAMRAIAFRGLKATLPRNFSLEDPLVRKIELAAEKERDPEARRNAAVLMAWLDLKTAYAYAETLLLMRSYTADDMLAAIEAFDLLGEGRAIPKLIELTNDGNPKVRLAAVNALGHVGDRSALKALNRLLEDPDQAVREAAQAAIKEVSPRPAAPIETYPPDEGPVDDTTPEIPIPETTQERPLPVPPGPPPGPVPF